ncbi:MAG: hypothetical protein WDZ82_00430 [Candidatus Paceibacterota bacterium]
MFIKHNYSHPLLRKFLSRHEPQNVRPVRAGSARMRQYLSVWRRQPEAARVIRECQRVDEENAFKAIDGSAVYTLVDLHELLRRLETEHYEHHTGGTCNDFSCWLRDVWNEEIAAELISRAAAQAEAAAILERLCRRRGEL